MNRRLYILALSCFLAAAAGCGSDEGPNDPVDANSDQLRQPEGMPPPEPVRE